MTNDHKNLHVYLARVFRTGEDCVGLDDILSIDEFARIAEKLHASTESEPPADMLPVPLENVCGADRVDSFVVDPAGKLFKCWNSVGRGDKFVGDE